MPADHRRQKLVKSGHVAALADWTDRIKAETFTFIDTCFGPQHLNFAEDEANTLWFSNNTQGENAVVS